MSNRLIVAPNSGLGNRLLAVLSGHRLARRLGREVGVLWYPNEECCCEFHDLFASQICVTNEQVHGLPVVDRSWYAHEHRASGLPLVQYPKDGDFVIRSNTVFVADNEVRNRFRHQGAELEEFKGSFQELGPLPAIIDPVDDFCDGLEFDNCIGLHIRRGYRDEKFDTTWFDSVGLDVYKRLAGNCVEAGYRLHVCSDDESVIEIFQSGFGATSFPVSSREKGEDVQAIQDALKDMLVMSRSKYIVSLYGSTFSYLSAVLGQSTLICVKNDHNHGLRLEKAVNFSSFTPRGTARTESNPIEL